VTPASALRARVVPLAMRARLEALAAADPAIAKLASVLGEPRIWHWAHAIGVSTDPGLAALAPPIPPRELRSRCGEPDAEVFLWTGILDLEVVLDAFDAHGRVPAGRRPAILDFGCGCGRLTRYLASCRDVADVRAAEPDPTLAAWCRAHLAGIETAATAPMPPLPYDDATFHLVFALSVLAYLPALALEAWIGELKRVLAPAGILVATVPGARALERDRGVAELAPVAGRTARRAGLAPAIQGSAGATEPMRRRGLDVVATTPGGLRGWQDVVVARKPR
jgi:SAM-dependent methyltransferase